MSLLQLFTATDAAPYAWSLVLSGGTVVASILPLGAARSAANFQMEDMAAPRAMFERFPAWGKRASWAHQNSFEAFTLHAPAALLAVVAVLHNGPLPSTAVVAAFAQNTPGGGSVHALPMAKKVLLAWHSQNAD